jgi:hypothetical protein
MRNHLSRSRISDKGCRDENADCDCLPRRWQPDSVHRGLSADLLRMYNTTQRDGVGFNLAYIGSDFTQVLPEPFDPAYMRALFDYGYQRARRGYDWAKKPTI